MDTTIKYPFHDLGAVNAPHLHRVQEAAARVVASGYYVGGPEVARFEHDLAALTGTRHAVGVSNGLDALRLILRAYIERGDMRPGDEVIVPANTYIATILAITDNGLKPVPVEPDCRTLNLDTSLIERAVTDRTRAIMTVHLYGRICYDAEMSRAAARHGLKIIEDNAQAIGASTAGGRHSGALGDVAAFSFYPTKNLGAMGDGGAVTTDDAELAAIIRALANYGSDRRYHNIYRGLNCRLDPIQAAILSAKMPYLADENTARAANALIYETHIDNPLVTKPLFSDGGDMVWHQYVVQTADRDRFRSFLAEKGVETGVHYPVAPHRQPCMRDYASLNLPIAEHIAATCVSLPVSSGTSADDAREIARIINSYTTPE